MAITRRKIMRYPITNLEKIVSVDPGNLIAFTIQGPDC